MLYFHSVEAGGNERLESLAIATIARMRPDRERPGCVRDGDRILERESRLRDERTARGAEVSHECVAEIMNHAARDERTRHVWTSHRAPIRLLQHFVQRLAQLLQSRLLEETVTQLLASEELWLLVDEIARSPSVTEAISHQGVSFLDQVSDSVRDRSRDADAWVERAARRLGRRRNGSRSQEPGQGPEDSTPDTGGGLP